MLQVVRECLFLLYVHVPIYRFTVIQTLTLLTSAVPSVPFLSASLIQKLLSAVDGLSHSKDPDEVYRMSTMTEVHVVKQVYNTSSRLHVHVVEQVQYNLWIEDTLGPALLSRGCCFEFT